MNPNPNTNRPCFCGSFDNFLGTRSLDVVALPPAAIPGIAKPNPPLISLLVTGAPADSACVALTTLAARGLASKLLRAAAELEAMVAPKAAA